MVKNKGLRNRIIFKGAKNRKITHWQGVFNKAVSCTRYKVERTFGPMRRWFNSGTARYVGIIKTHSQHLLEAMAHNLYRAPRGIISTSEKQRAKSLKNEVSCDLQALKYVKKQLKKIQVESIDGANVYFAMVSIEKPKLISRTKRLKVKEITIDLSPSMNLIAESVFPTAEIVSDRFHVQKLMNEAVGDLRISYRWEAIDEENAAMKVAAQIYRSDL